MSRTNVSVVINHNLRVEGSTRFRDKERSSNPRGPINPMIYGRPGVYQPGEPRNLGERAPYKPRPLRDTRRRDYPTED